MRRCAAPLLALLAIAFAFASCGDNANAFKEDYNEAIRPLSSLGDDIGASLRGAAGESNDELATRYDRLAERADRVGQNLKDLDPPDDAREELDELVASLSQGAEDLRALAEAATSGNPSKAADASRALVQTGERIQEAETDLRDAVDG